ncbi:MAG: CHAD domain-containing protein [Propionicimonas sp.]
MSAPLEVERKYALAAGQDLPPLTGVVTAGPVHEFDLIATYYDSPDFRLNTARVTLRRRTGGHDDGWHLKSPGTGPDERFEDSLPVSAGEPWMPPPAFRERVEGVLSGAPLIPVATLRTHRREQDLLDEGGTVVALACTDRVRSLVAGRREKWREAEVELAAGDPALLERIEAVLTGAGIQRATVGSKVARAIAGSLAAKGAARADTTAGHLVKDYLATQVGVLQRFTAALSGTDPEAVHDARVATRRLRSTLRTYGVLFRPKDLNDVVDRLRKFTRVLGPARDAEVVLAHLRQDAAEIGDGDFGGQFEWVFGPLEQAVNTSREQLGDYLEATAYRRLQKSLSALLASSRQTKPAKTASIEVLGDLRSAMVAKVAAQAEQAAAGPGNLALWHGVRKSAKVVRYATELVVPAMPSLAGQRAAWEQVTESLGIVQDLGVAHERLSGLALRAVAQGASGTAFDELRLRSEDRLGPALSRGRQALALALAGE